MYHQLLNIVNCKTYQEYLRFDANYNNVSKFVSFA